MKSPKTRKRTATVSANRRTKKTALQTARKKKTPRSQKNSRKTKPKVSLQKKLMGIVKSLPKQQGCMSFIYIQECDGKHVDQFINSSFYKPIKSVKSNVTRRKGGAVASRSTLVSDRIAVAYSAVAHPVRIEILMKLLDGPAIYRSLQKLTNLKAGPLYHHINQLRLAGLIFPKQRDLYELTRGGRNLAMIIMTLGSAVTDQRRRPLSSG